MAPSSMNNHGGHAGLMTDILRVHLLMQSSFTWGIGNLVNAGNCRKQYISASRPADRYDFGPLLAFVRS